ncbi:short-chain dehydrogenase [Candidatus Peribacteria bacterium RIFCSPHIGHO2_02_FULL_53_20]|nr:MAG: short-chain dehydrogenase [Candidatus Peribacteria bacterium RIFCSPHIGHO2_02_FULL_53_20]OGJ68023.1 MAG: short-chain dehydrogenase [Candidatus Peribacteria bacterium RIFCSPLOWO2_01_FULL_53_10]OGJ73295.1 MAG: short-chain dehydrogenase [Candidatus Peribacteria bacterium RIFCSPLOWO2_12_FULL_53_10]
MKTTLITGASGGLGVEFAKLFAADGYDLVLVARNQERLQALAKELESTYNVAAHVIATDLSQPNAATMLVEEVRKKNMMIHTLVNNAGFGAFGLFHETPYDQEKQLLQVNITALTDLTKLLLPQMVQRKSGAILNVASTASFQPGPLMAVYYASKAYVMNFSLALSVELKGTGVTVTCLCPGPTKTGFEKNAHMGTSRLFQKRVMDAATVSQIGYRALKSGRPLVVAGKLNAFGAFMTRFIPRIWVARIARQVQVPR